MAKDSRLSLWLLPWKENTLANESSRSQYFVGDVRNGSASLWHVFLALFTCEHNHS
jgi:hypothetical protein